MSSDWDREIQQNDSPLYQNYQRLRELNVKTKADICKSLQNLHIQTIEQDEELQCEIGSALRRKQSRIKKVQKESHYSCQRVASISKTPSQLNLSRESIEKKGILKKRESFQSSSSSEKISQKHVKFCSESSKFVHMVLK
ncbi:unnamed protein product (macronuclear) [Paramecium tetraurelia]|uniref:Uncharacterized protein n=1 Tax=Paramecium tetraurelia TaxID=5888 RepID=A0BI77_PARTE|nr:uncharacterized protein GSPATT00029280001 [Paramecium tetraurelia]CAK58244.1 unnamed protein product [Paramecium tetraurelia]|eukprot:XP_001425642.1 hypothetical protein (macronuclear) [Paramecium tetraurelia strain d4-2]